MLHDIDYDPSHSWYYKLGGRPLRLSAYKGYLGDDIHT